MGKKAYLRQAAQELGLTYYQLRRMSLEKRIPYLTSGNRKIFDIDQCKEYLKNEAMQNMKPIQNEVKQYGTLRRIKA